MPDAPGFPVSPCGPGGPGTGTGTATVVLGGGALVGRSQALRPATAANSETSTGVVLMNRSPDGQIFELNLQRSHAPQRAAPGTHAAACSLIARLGHRGCPTGVLPSVVRQGEQPRRGRRARVLHLPCNGSPTLRAWLNQSLPSMHRQRSRSLRKYGYVGSQLRLSWQTIRCHGRRRLHWRSVSGKTSS
jgi:hypothetical protein